MKFLFNLSLGLSLLASTALAEEPICHPTEENVYDFVVVGAGTAGAAAAGELARALPDATVLLLDHGKDYSDDPIVMDNDQFGEMQETPYCEHHFSYETTLASGGSWSRARNIYACVSKVMGGASSINYGGWYRAPQSDLDEWAELSGNDIWNYDNMLPYFKRLEAVSREPGAQQNPDRGYDGVIPVRHENISIIHHYTGMVGAIEEYMNVSVGDQDNNNRHQDAIGALQVSRVKDGCWYGDDGEELGCAANLRNGSSYNAFVRDPQRKGELPNLHILEGAKVVQLKNVTADNEDGDMTIEYVLKSYRYQVKARHEILLSAGTWGNPKIALMSGIGNATELAEVGIESKIDLPGVGRHLQDHGVLWMTAMLNNVQAADLTNTTVADLGFDPMTFSGVNNPLPALMARANAINMYFKSDESLEYPDMEFLAGLAPAGPTNGMMLLRLYQNRGSSGEGGFLKLRSDDPWENMDTSRNWYADEESIQPMLKSLKTLFEMVSTGMAKAAPMILEPNAWTLDFNDDEALKKYIRENVVSELHLQGSMKMGVPEKDLMAVVDGNLKLVGGNGRLRVADTSIFPTEVRGHPMATAMAIGMRAAALLVEDYQGSTSVASDTADLEVEKTAGSEPALRAGSAAGKSGECAFAVAAAAASTCAFALSV